MGAFQGMMMVEAMATGVRVRVTQGRAAGKVMGRVAVVRLVRRVGAVGRWTQRGQVLWMPVQWVAVGRLRGHLASILGSCLRDLLGLLVLRRAVWGLISGPV